MRRKRNPQVRIKTTIYLGGETVCACDCGRKFPASKSSNGMVRKWYDPDYCPRRFRDLRKKKLSRTEIGLKAQKTTEKRKDDGVKFRKVKYDRKKECCTDSKGRDCVCVKYSACLDKIEKNKPTPLEIRIYCGIRRHCYQPSVINGNQKALGTTSPTYHKYIGARGGAE